LAGYVAQARQLADEVLFPAAMAVDRSDAVPVGHFERLAEAGLYALAGPAELGGLDTESAPAAAAPSVAGPVLEALAGGCLATAFVWAQHHGLVRMLHREAGPELRDRWLGPACRGEVRGGLALAGLLPGPPRLRAEPAAGGWRLDGTWRWVTGWGSVDLLRVAGRTADGRIESVRIVPDGSAVANYGFDVTPARLVTGLITERGVIAATREELARAFPERAEAAARPARPAAE